MFEIRSFCVSLHTNNKDIVINSRYSKDWSDKIEQTQYVLPCQFYCPTIYQDSQPTLSMILLLHTISAQVLVQRNIMNKYHINAHILNMENNRNFTFELFHSSTFRDKNIKLKSLEFRQNPSRSLIEPQWETAVFAFEIRMPWFYLCKEKQRSQKLLENLVNTISKQRE